MYEYEVKVLRRKLSDNPNFKYDEGVTAEASYIVTSESAGMVPVIMNHIDLTDLFDVVDAKLDKMDIE